MVQACSARHIPELPSVCIHDCRLVVSGSTAVVNLIMCESSNNNSNVTMFTYRMLDDRPVLSST